MKTYPYEIVWMTTQATGTPHAAALQAANPGLRIHVKSPAAAGNGPGQERTGAWRNCDRNIRVWWRDHRGQVTTESVLFLEYDVLVNVPLLPVVPSMTPGVGIAGAAVLTAVADGRKYWPFRETNRLPVAIRSHAIGIAPLAFLQISRHALDRLIDQCYDQAFAADIFCELRLPTVIRHAGYQVAALDLPEVGVKPLQPGPGERGIFHPVKPRPDSNQFIPA